MESAVPVCVIADSDPNTTHAKPLHTSRKKSRNSPLVAELQRSSLR